MAEARFRKIDAATIEDHTHLTLDDNCYFLLEYTSHKGFGFGEANDLISNLKKSPERKGRPEYKYKTGAMERCSIGLGKAINDEWLKTGTLVPTPPSKDRSHPAYDDRIAAICRGIAKPYAIDVRELVYQTAPIRAAHESPNNRPTVAELLAIYSIDESIAAPTPRAIAVIDDVLTAGTHFRAMHTVLSRRFPGVPIFGMFIARRIFPTEDATEFFGDD